MLISTGIYLLVTCPLQGLSHLILQLSDPAHLAILGVIGKDHAYKVSASQTLEVVEDLFNLLLILLMLLT